MLKPIPGWLIRAGVTGPYRRGGLNLSGGQKTTIAQSKLSAKKLAALEADPRVTIVEVELEPTKAAPKKAATKKTAADKKVADEKPKAEKAAAEKVKADKSEAERTAANQTDVTL
ncbi:MAG: hypothetical protein JKX72_06265 [Robiginitomaculum sp.]|nr:hypothetical protein [Robiginitomaculum sp.]